jgi:hypothetical protein
MVKNNKELGKKNIKIVQVPEVIKGRRSFKNEQ